MIKQFTVIVLSAFLLSLLPACGNDISSLADTGNTTQQTQHINTDQKEEAVNEPAKETVSAPFSGSNEGQEAENSLNGKEKMAVDNKILVVYFSCTGTTEALAGYAADILGADLYEIVPEKEYTKADLAYYTGGRADQEQNDPNVRPAILGSVENMDRYDTIILGFPIWHGQAPRIISTFLENYDFSEKTIVPFCTSHSSGIGTSADNLHSLCADSTKWKEGRRFGSETSKDTIEEWLLSIGCKVIE